MVMVAVGTYFGAGGPFVCTFGSFASNVETREGRAGAGLCPGPAIRLTEEEEMVVVAGTRFSSHGRVFGHSGHHYGCR